MTLALEDVSDRLEGKVHLTFGGHERPSAYPLDFVSFLHAFPQVERLLVAKAVDALEDVAELMDVVDRGNAAGSRVDRRRHRVERQTAEACVVKTEAFC